MTWTPTVGSQPFTDTPGEGWIVLIYSGEHRAWWRPSGEGYTQDRDSAGRWRLDDARRKVAHCGPEKKIEFHLAARPERVIKAPHA